MQRYYFHLRKSGVREIEDEEGAGFACLEDAYLEAFKGAQELSQVLMRERRDPSGYAYEIVAGNGVVLMDLPFSEVLDIGHPVRPRPFVRAAARATAGLDKTAIVQAARNAEQMMRLSAELGENLRITRQSIAELSEALTSPALPIK